MFESAYQRTMKYASRILCAISFIYFAAGTIGALFGIGRLGPLNEFQADWLLVLNALIVGVNGAVAPLIGAAAIHRFDQYRRAIETSN